MIRSKGIAHNPNKLVRNEFSRNTIIYKYGYVGVMLENGWGKGIKSLFIVDFSSKDLSKFIESYWNKVNL